MCKYIIYYSILVTLLRAVSFCVVTDDLWPDVPCMPNYNTVILHQDCNLLFSAI